MWSKTKTKRFDMTLSGRNVVKERSRLLPVHMAPGRGFNSKHYKSLDIRDLLLGQYAPSWRLERSRDLSSSVQLDNAIVNKEDDVVDRFLIDKTEEEEKKLQRKFSRGLTLTGSGMETSRSKVMKEGGEASNLPNKHQTLEDEYRALRDLTRTELRYIPNSSSSSREYINFVEPKPLHATGGDGGGEYDDEYEDDEVDEGEEGYDHDYLYQSGMNPRVITEQDLFNPTTPGTAALIEQGYEAASFELAQDETEYEDDVGRESSSETNILVLEESYSPGLSTINESVPTAANTGTDLYGGDIKQDEIQEVEACNSSEQNTLSENQFQQDDKEEETRKATQAEVNTQNDEIQKVTAVNDVNLREDDIDGNGENAESDDTNIGQIQESNVGKSDESDDDLDNNKGESESGNIAEDEDEDNDPERLDRQTENHADKS